MEGLKVLSTGYYVPTKVVSNLDFEKSMDTSDAWIVERTGIKNRHFVTDETNVDIGYQAAKKAIENSGVEKEKIGIIIVATMSPDSLTPSTACLIQQKLGLNNQQVMAFDISAACSGFVYALTITNSLLQTMPNTYALVIGSEVLSNIIDFKDRGTCILFGDGAGALLVKNSQQLFVSYNDSCGEKEPLYANVRGENNYLQMNGREVFKFAVKVVPLCIEKVLQQAKLSIEDIDYIVCHQANYRIISHVYKKLQYDPNKFFINLDEYGNTSGASIPLALGEMDEKNMLQPGMKVICVGFGGGLTWGATLLEW